MKAYPIIWLFLPFGCFGQSEEPEKRNIIELQIQQHYSNAFTRPAENTVNWEETKSYLDTAIIPCISNSIGFRYSFYLSSHFYFRTGAIYGRKTYMKSPKNRHTTSGGPPPYPIGYKLYEIPPKKIRIPLEINYIQWLYKKKIQLTIGAGLELQSRNDMIEEFSGILSKYNREKPSTLRQETKGILGFRYDGNYDPNMPVRPVEYAKIQNIHLLNFTSCLGFKYHPSRQFELSLEYQFSIGESFRNVNEGKYYGYSLFNKSFIYKTKGYAQSIQLGFGIYI